MKKLSGTKDIDIPLTNGILDARTAAGEGNITDFRLLLNTSTWDERGRSRLPGWSARRSASPSNEDLHDQLLGASPLPSIREAITLLGEAVSTSHTVYSIAATKSRIYASGGRSRNWRMLADGMGGPPVGDYWPIHRFSMAQMGDYLMFTNGMDPVRAWQLGGETCFEVYDLLGLEITRAGVIAAWGGFVLLGDVMVGGEEYGSRIYWSDYNRPLEWAPGGESVASYVDLGRGERVLAILPIANNLRVYTDKAIYSVDLVGGEAVFLFREIYRGDLALAYKHGIVTIGDTHVWLTKNSLVTAGQYDRTPKMFDWMHRAAGFIFNGVSSEVLNALPVGFSAFSGLDVARCHQIAMGWDGKLENIWLSWPTKTADAQAPDGVRRITMLINPRYNRTTLIDHGFSSFASLRKSLWESVRDFLLANTNGESTEPLLGDKEGESFITIDGPNPAPTCVWNSSENPDEPFSPHPGNGEDPWFGYGEYPPDAAISLASLVKDRYLDTECAACQAEPFFCMASVLDLSIKEFRTDTRAREVYVIDGDTPAVFPQASEGAYVQAGYPTVIQGEVSKHTMLNEKTVTRMGLSIDVVPEQDPGKIYVQLGVSNSPHCVDWRDTLSRNLDCQRDGAPRADENTLRAARPLSFPFYRSGCWIAYRIFVADSEGDFAPAGIDVTFNEATIAARVKNETWTNQ